jgi:hypothetical protein
MEKKKPRNRETYTTNTKGNGAKRRGSGLGTGPVGNKKEKKNK